MTCQSIIIQSIHPRIIIIDMEIPQPTLLEESTQLRKQALLQKRLKAKQKISNIQMPPPNKQEIRKERNRHAAQKSRDRKKCHLQNLEIENARLKEIMSRCSVCSAEERLHQEANPQINQEDESIIKEEIVHITQTSPPIFLNQTFIRMENDNEDSSSSNLSKYFWFACLFVILIMANYQNKGLDPHRQLFQTQTNPIVPPVTSFVQMQKQMPRKVVPNKTLQTNNISHSLIPKKYCRQCYECFKNMTDESNGKLSLFGNPSNSTSTNTTTNNTKILFCKSRAKFFLQIYEALQQKDQKNSRQITRMLVKGKILNDLMSQDCFSGQQINEEQEYIINFTVAILEMTPVRMSRASRLSTHSD